ncbi:MAG: B12-binding domain-containing radical SAM protein [Gemmataceae bacterium]
MELPSRPKNDRYTEPGEYNELEKRLRSNPATAEIAAVVAYAFDFRTSLGPYVFLDTKLITAGPRAVGAAMYSAGFKNTRVVMRQWTRNFRPRMARINGKIPELLLISSMQINSASAYEMLEDAYRLGEDRPFILCGGAKAIYEPWDFFGRGPNSDMSADVVVTGEEFVLLQLLDRLMEFRSGGEHLRKTFHRLRRSGLLDDIPGLVFREGDEREPLTRLIDTGIQRLVQNLDELPHPLLGLSMLEAPHRRYALGKKALSLTKLRKYARIISVVTTHGCKFRCSYCPIPAYNQFTFRTKSPDLTRQEIQDMAEKTGVHNFFSTDDNFFNNRDAVEEIFTEMAKGKIYGQPFRDSLFFGTEATEFDVYKNNDLLPICREGGLRAIWFGIEDMTAELVKKGQTPDKTREVFQMLNDIGIAPMAMMMHHDGQPLTSKGNLYGLLNQVNYLRRSGAVSAQITMLMPSVGSKGYQDPYREGMVIEEAGEEKVEDRHYDGNHCIATNDPNPWRKQLNIYLAYGSFYNPLNFVRTILNWKDQSYSLRLQYQIFGMAGLVKSFWNGWKWLSGLRKGPVKKLEGVPSKKLEVIEAPAKALGSHSEAKALGPTSDLANNGTLSLPLLEG